MTTLLLVTGQEYNYNFRTFTDTAPCSDAVNSVLRSFEISTNIRLIQDEGVAVEVSYDAMKGILNEITLLNMEDFHIVDVDSPAGLAEALVNLIFKGDARKGAW